MAGQVNDDGRRYPAHPRVGVGVVVVRDGRLLMVRRAEEPNRGKWSIPGGLIELGETIAEAAVREVYEECSVKVEIVRVLDAVDTVVRDDDGRIRYHYTIIDLLGRYLSGRARARSDAGECRWVDAAGLGGLDMTDTLREMLRRNTIV